MDRRDFTRLAISVGLAPVLGEIAHAQGISSKRIRRDVASVDAAKDIAAFRKGVEILKRNLISTDYDSWIYWANSHGMPAPIPEAMKNVWYKCEHGSTHFLTWHRAYVFFLEALIREKSGDETFALPYWNWLASTQLPLPFLTETVGGEANTLFHPSRNYRHRTLVTSALRRGDFYEFGSMLEANPHGTIHTIVGGDMGRVETSARDPLFWLHHCNVDRMWSIWLDQDPVRRNPSDPSWLGKQFAFDVAQTKTQRVSDMLVTTGVLDYTYDNLKVTEGQSRFAPQRPLATVDVPLAQRANTVGTQPLSKPLTMSQEMPLALMGGSVTMNFSVPGGAARRMDTMSTPDRRSSLKLVLKDVKATPTGIRRGADYRIYLNLPRDVKDQYPHDDFYLGSINTFSLSHHQGSHYTTMTFDLGTRASILARLGQWSNSSVSISLLSDDNDDTLPLIEIGDVQLLLLDAPLE